MKCMYEKNSINETHEFIPALYVIYFIIDFIKF